MTPSPRARRAKAATAPKTITPIYAEFLGDKQFATTLARGLEILRCFTPQEPVLGNKELARMTGLPKPTISRFTYTLSRLGYLHANERFGKYQLGSAVLSIGYPLLATIALRQVARPAMRELADYSQGSVSMGIRDRLSIVYIEASRSTSAFSSQLSDIGLAQPIPSTAIGRAYLAACGAQERNALLNEIRVKQPAEWQRYRERITQSLAEFEQRGFCVAEGDLRPDIHAVGVPFRRLSDGTVIVFNCSVHSFLLKPGQLEKDIGPRLAAMVKSLEFAARLA